MPTEKEHGRLTEDGSGGPSGSLPSRSLLTWVGEAAWGRQLGTTFFLRSWMDLGWAALAPQHRVGSLPPPLYVHACVHASRSSWLP